MSLPIKYNHQLIGNFCYQWIKWWWSSDLNYLCQWPQLLPELRRKYWFSIQLINVNSQEFPGEARINHGQSWLQRLCHTWQRHHTHLKQIFTPATRDQAYLAPALSHYIISNEERFKFLFWEQWQQHIFRQFDCFITQSFMNKHGSSCEFCCRDIWYDSDVSH